VIFPTSTEQISEIHKYCFKNEIGIIPYGQGSGFEGGVINTNVDGRPTVTLDMMKNMTQVLGVHGAPDRYAKVQAGVQRELLNEYIRDTGLWFPIDPGANATIGGMTATSASGTNAVKYGTMKENVINLRAVLPDGTIFDSAGEDRSFIKSSAGYNLTELFTGSEGTLGTISEITVRLHPIESHLIAASCKFPSILQATTAAEQILSLGVPVARLEFLDEIALEAVTDETPDCKAALYFELSSSSEAFLKEQVESINWLCEENDSFGFKSSTSLEERTKIWNARHRAYWSMINKFQYGKTRQGYSTDVCVPISKVGECIIKSKELVKNSKYLNKCGGIIGHIGDGNFHVFFGVDTSDEAEFAELKFLADEIAKLALENNGTITGEHGIGLGKKHLLEKQVGTASYGIMKLIKATIDPKNIMNPGKVF